MCECKLWKRNFRIYPKWDKKYWKNGNICQLEGPTNEIYKYQDEERIKRIENRKERILSYRAKIRLKLKDMKIIEEKECSPNKEVNETSEKIGQNVWNKNKNDKNSDENEDNEAWKKEVKKRNLEIMIITTPIKIKPKKFRQEENKINY